ncbi:MAG: ABC transporter ATP-binding protein [bacterium]|nr:ABC transporter ATP-binding protein [bacterium]
MIELQHVTVRAGDYLVDDISFRVEHAQYAVLMGKTGIGKTTILESICGLRKISSGKLLIDEHDVTDALPGDRQVGYVPQDLALFPTLSVREHLEFAMRLRRQPRDKIAARVRELAEVLGIESLLPRGVQGLSGGESQRVALGRALSFGPSVLLLDEPLSALDADTRGATQDLLKRVNQQTGVSVLHVTHNLEEAEALADVRLELVREPPSHRLKLRHPGDIAVEH